MEWLFVKTLGEGIVTKTVSKKKSKNGEMLVGYKGSHVALETAICPVCGKQFDTGYILLRRQLRPVFPEYGTAQPTSYQLCPEHQDLFDRGYIALVGCDPEKSKMTSDAEGSSINSVGDAYRTGKIAHIKREAWSMVMNVPLPTDRKGQPLPFAFCDDAAIRMLQGLAEDSSQAEEKDHA